VAGRIIHQSILAVVFMHINNSKKIVINKDGVIYALIFVLYATLVVLVFVYATKFLRDTLNTALSTPAGATIEAKYGQLDLGNYVLVADKLGLKKPSVNQIVTPEVINPVASPTIEIATNSPEIIASPTPEVVTISPAPEVMPIVAPEVVTPVITPVVVELRPLIVIFNSTGQAGLAAKLKNQLTAVGYSVLETGNIKPIINNTIIKIKTSLNPDSKYLAEIKKIVALNYDFVLENLAESSDHEVEIIIGSK